VRDERIKKATVYIEEHFRSKLTRSQMAAAANLSTFYFSRLFRRHVGLSPEAYVLNCRLRYAAKLLALRGRIVPSPTWRPTADLRIRVISVGFFGAPSARRPNNTDVSKRTNRLKDRTYVLDGPRPIDSTRRPAASRMN
jgi:AraC-like DNA-binding protein